MDDYPLLNLFLTMLYLFLWVMWFFLLFKVITDLFRDHSLDRLGQGRLAGLRHPPAVPGRAGLPHRPGPQHAGKRDAKVAKDSEAAFRQYVREAANSEGSAAGTSHVNDLAKLAELRGQGRHQPGRVRAGEGETPRLRQRRHPEYSSPALA
ncbi:Membrane protein OS=Streptomyces microflavus OX=1919 GN=Smic_73000 PE=4 SV=1 [Streptomyces microflavus]